MNLGLGHISDTRLEKSKNEPTPIETLEDEIKELMLEAMDLQHDYTVAKFKIYGKVNRIKIEIAKQASEYVEEKI